MPNPVKMGIGINTSLYYQTLKCVHACVCACMRVCAHVWCMCMLVCVGWWGGWAGGRLVGCVEEDAGEAVPKGNQRARTRCRTLGTSPVHGCLLLHPFFFSVSLTYPHSESELQNGWNVQDCEFTDAFHFLCAFLSFTSLRYIKKKNRVGKISLTKAEVFRTK